MNQKDTFSFATNQQVCNNNTVIFFEGSNVLIFPLRFSRTFRRSRSSCCSPSQIRDKLSYPSGTVYLLYPKNKMRRIRRYRVLMRSKRSKCPEISRKLRNAKLRCDNLLWKINKNNIKYFSMTNIDLSTLYNLENRIKLFCCCCCSAPIFHATV